MSHINIKSFGKRQKQFLVYVYQNQKVAVDNPVLKYALTALRKKKLVYFQAGRVVITKLGKQVVETELKDYLVETKAVYAEMALVVRKSGDMNLNKKLGKNQKELLLKIHDTPLLISKKHSSNFLNQLIAGLENQGLIKRFKDQIRITKYGKGLLANPLNIVGSENFSQTANYAKNIFAGLFLTKKSLLKKQELRFLKFISKSPRLVTEIRGAKHIIPILKDRELLVITDNKLWITDQGRDLLNSMKKHVQLSSADGDFSGRFISSAKIQSQGSTFEKGNKFLKLYMQGLTYQAIGDMHGITRERVRQYLIQIPVFHEYLKTLKQHQADLVVIKKERERERNVRAEQRRKLNNLAIRFPAQVNELWDYKKNGSRKPEIVTVGQHVNIWLQCPLDGHSWQKKPSEVVQSWKMGASGCFECAKRTRRKETIQSPEKLIESFPIEVARYWNYSRNIPLQLDPSILTTLSKKKAWFHCPSDKFDWQANVSAISSEYWKEGRSGCPLCGRGWTVESLLQFIASKS